METLLPPEEMTFANLADGRVLARAWEDRGWSVCKVMRLREMPETILVEYLKRKFVDA